MTTCTCDNCGWAGDESHVTPFEDWSALADRLDAGSEVPVGDCPNCAAFVYRNPTTYTVLLQRPDYIADNYGLDTYLWRGAAASAPEAVLTARCAARVADGTTDEGELDDYAVLLVIAGTHDDLNPER